MNKPQANGSLSTHRSPDARPGPSVPITLRVYLRGHQHGLIFGTQGQTRANGIQVFLDLSVDQLIDDLILPLGLEYLVSEGIAQRLQ